MTDIDIDIEIDTCPVCHEPVHASESDDEGRCSTTCSPHAVHVDEPTRTPMQRYEDATGPDGWLTAAGWEALAADLMANADTVERARNDHGVWGLVGGLATAYRDRAADCRDRANALRAA